MNKFGPEGICKHTFGYTVAELKKAMENHDIVEGVVAKCDTDMTLYIDLGHNIVGTITADEFENNINGKVTKQSAIMSKVGKTLKFIVTDVTKGEDATCVKLSRREAQKLCLEKYISTFKPGQIIDAVVTYVESFGAFCDVGCGISALLPIENIAVVKCVNPRKWYRGMHKIKAVIKSLENNKITLSHMELLGTWDEEASKFNVGDTVTGIIRNIEDYGIFVELAPNLVGLADVYPEVAIGDAVSVFIRDIIRDRMKIKLIIMNNNGQIDARKPIYFRYKLPSSGFVKDWVYSPETCDRVVEVHYDND